MQRATPTTEVLATSIRLRTIGDIARDLGVPYYRVRYALRTCEAIKPARRIGNYPIFDDAAVELIQQRITEITLRSSSEPTRGCSMRP